MRPPRSYKGAVAPTFRSPELRILDGDALQDVGDILPPIDGLLQQRVHILPLDDVDSVVFLLEELTDGLPDDGVALILQVVDPDPVLGHVLALVQLVDGLYQFVPDLQQDLPHLLRLGRDLAYSIDDDGVG